MSGRTLFGDLAAGGTDPDLQRMIETAASACARVAGTVRYSPVRDILDSVNASGDTQQMLDILVDDEFHTAFSSGGLNIAHLTSEERMELVAVSEPLGDYSVAYDPVDGSQNVSDNLAFGSIFAFHRGPLLDGRKPRESMRAAMFAVYGPSTTILCTVGKGCERKVNEYCLNEDGSWVLLKENIKMKPEARRLCSGGAEPQWKRRHKLFINRLRKEGCKDFFTRCFVADISTALLRGDFIFTYPEYWDQKSSSWKALLRPVYELHAAAYLLETAGGTATDGTSNILDIIPKGLHERIPFYGGCRETVALASKYLRGEIWQ